MVVHILFTPALNKSYETACPEIIENEIVSVEDAVAAEREPNANW